MKILVTGSSGTIGTRLCERLLQTDHEILCVDWEPNKWIKTLDERTLRIDLRDAKAVEQIPSDIDIIVHLAANARVYELVVEPVRALDNFITLFNMLEFARKGGIRKFIFSSSRESYGNIEVEKLTEELASVVNCESPYTASKIGGEALVRSYERCYGIDMLIFRFSNVYGMYDDSVRVVPQFIRNARANETLTVFGKEKCLDFTYIDDCVNGILLGIEKFEEAKNDVYNLAFGEGVTLMHLAERVIGLLDSASKIDLQESRTGEVIRYVADIQKAKRVLGYNPQIPFDEGIEKSVEWYREHS
ncbi:MAG: NAD-dependent epimerase/dehydratase family protein [Candidatus Peribacteraceae bacterium]|nr:NAD-dependent epimerase/dehydratase family protein [Candidatus Peribacteraceae bacterium]